MSKANKHKQIQLHEVTLCSRKEGVRDEKNMETWLRKIIIVFLPCIFLKRNSILQTFLKE